MKRQLKKRKRKLQKIARNHATRLWIGLFMLLFFGFSLFLVSHKFKSVMGIKITPFLSTFGTQLIDHGKKYTFTGFNMYQIASLPGHNAGCGGSVDDMNGLFATLRPNSIVRLWAWQGSMATNPTTKQLDFAGIDRVLAAAKQYHQRVILSLGTQSGQCDDGLWKGSSWYQGGYKTVYNPSGLTPLSYWDYVIQIVSRYKTSQTVAMWELVNEPETSDCTGYSSTACYGHQTCPDHTQAANTLRQFFDTVGGMVKSIDPNHLIESGLIGTGQCGSDNSNYTYVHQSAAIDVASYHDYNSDTSPIPGDSWNGLSVRLSQMQSISKPLIIGEVGMLALQSGGSCMTLEQRTSNMKAKMDAMFAHGIAGFIPWNRTVGQDTTCNYDIGNTDPLVSLINSYQLPK